MVDGTHFRLGAGWTARRRRPPRARRRAVGPRGDGRRAGRGVPVARAPGRRSATTDVLALHAGAEALAAECGVTIAGGDLVAGPALTIAVTVVGWAGDEARARRPRRRAAGRPRRRHRRPRRPRPPAWRCSSGRARRHRPSATCARGRGSPRAARWPRPARARCSTSPTASRSTRGGWPRRAACGSSSTRTALPLAAGDAEVGRRARDQRRPSWPPPAARTTSCCSARRRRRATAAEAAAAVTWIGRATAGVPGVEWRGDPSAARWRGYEH